MTQTITEMTEAERSDWKTRKSEYEALQERLKGPRARARGVESKVRKLFDSLGEEGVETARIKHKIDVYHRWLRKAYGVIDGAEMALAAKYTKPRDSYTPRIQPPWATGGSMAPMM